MKLEQFFTMLFCLFAVIAILYFVTRAYDEIEIEYDPTTGRQKVRMSKNRMLEGPEPLTLEGE